MPKTPRKRVLQRSRNRQSNLSLRSRNRHRRPRRPNIPTNQHHHRSNNRRSHPDRDRPNPHTNRRPPNHRRRHHRPHPNPHLLPTPTKRPHRRHPRRHPTNHRTNHLRRPSNHPPLRVAKRTQRRSDRRGCPKNPYLATPIPHPDSGGYRAGLRVSAPFNVIRTDGEGNSHPPLRPSEGDAEAKQPQGMPATQPRNYHVPPKREPYLAKRDHCKTPSFRPVPSFRRKPESRGAVQRGYAGVWT